MTLITDVSIFVFATLGLCAVGAVLWFTLMWLFASDGPFPRVRLVASAVLAVVYTILFASLAIATVEWLITRGGGNDGRFSHPGGQGPETVCWYETRDEVVTVKPVTTAERTYTVCAANPAAVPQEVQPR